MVQDITTFLAQLFAMTQLQSLVVDVEPMDGSSDCSNKMNAVETAVAQVQSVDHHQLTRLHFKCQETLPELIACSDELAALLQQLSELRDLNICFRFSQKQCSFLGSLSKLEHVRIPVVEFATAEDWRALGVTMNELNSLQTLRVESYI